MRRHFGWALAPVVSISLGGLSVASAADMAVKARPLAVDPGYNWTGFYAGVNVGGVWGTGAFGWNANPAGFQPNPAEALGVSAAGTNNIKSSGFIGGGQVGYNWQMRNFLVGIEADIQYTGIGRTVTTGPIGSPIVIPAITTLTQSYSSHWLSTIRGRLGVTSGNWLFYGTGGAAIANVSFNDFVLFTNTLTTETGAVSSTRVGWAAGAGFEWAFNPAWRVKAEYLRVDLGSTGNNTVFDTNAVPASFVVQSHKLTEDMVRVGVNYAFGH
jgi:outer membrane immunogenic protein